MYLSVGRLSYKPIPIRGHLFAWMTLWVGLNVNAAGDNRHGDEHADGTSPFGLQHEFEVPETDDKISLNASLEVDAETSILDEDARLKARLDNALDSQNKNELVKFIDMEIGEQYKRKVLLTLGEIYETEDSPTLLIALYEKFILEFPRDRELPRLHLKLGRMYRDAGATKTALQKFYNVLNVALNVPMSDLKDYQEVSHRAQLEIAETFFMIGNYPQASKFFKRLLRVDLFEEDHRNILFKHAYTIYLSGNYSESVASLRSFITEYPESDFTAEARYLLSEAYLQLNDPKGALRETLVLLSAESNKINTNPEAWLYWKKRTGNKLANQFYQEGNYLDALTIYRAMVNLSREPVWTWPVLYQVGLCYEKLDMKPKAIEAYKEIVDTSSRLSEEMKDDLTLTSIEEMAAWRMERLDLDLNLEVNLNTILNNG